RRKRRTTDPHKILRRFFIRQQLLSGDTHELDSDTQNATVCNVGRRRWSRSAEAYPCWIGCGLCEYAVFVSRGDVFAHATLGTDDAVRLRIAGPLCNSPVILAPRVL